MLQGRAANSRINLGKVVTFFIAKDGSMTTARRDIVNYEDTRWYHCISRIARGLAVLDKYGHSLKLRIEDELRRLSKIFAIRVGGHAIMGTHFHLLLRVEVEEAMAWNSVEVVSRWALLCPPKDKKRRPLNDDELQFWIEENAKDCDFVEERRNRLMDLGWFHRFLKQPLSAHVNELEGCSGTLFQGRYKSIAVIGFQALLNVAIYIDLNPVAAGIVDLPENALHTSFRLRFENAIRNSLFPEAIDRYANCEVNQKNAVDMEESLWLVSIENRAVGDIGKGMFDELTLIQYMILVDEAGRLPRIGKAAISDRAVEILDRLGIKHAKWVSQQQRLAKSFLRGNYFSGNRSELQRVAERQGKRCIVNLGSCPC